jgi:hypothetical protein
MSDWTFLQVQAIQLRSMLQDAGDDPIIAPQLQERLDEVEAQMQAMQHESGSLLPLDAVVSPRAAIFLRGAGVQDSHGIRPSLAGEALIQYEKMFVEQALHDEREEARRAGRQRRPRGAPKPSLLFTGTPRGSFGLEFSPLATEDSGVSRVHAQTLHNVADVVVRISAANEDTLDEIVRSIPSRVLQPLKQFLRILSENQAELRLAFHDAPSKTLTSDQVTRTAERLERDIEQSTVTYTGVFRGVTRESGYFDLRLDDGTVITGTVADALTEDDLDRIDQLTNKPCIATLQTTTVRNVAGYGAPTFVLIDANSATGQQGESETEQIAQ